MSDSQKPQANGDTIVVPGWLIFIPAILLTLVLGCFAGQFLQKRMNSAQTEVTAPVAEAPAVIDPAAAPVEGSAPVAPAAPSGGDAAPELELYPTLPAGAVIPRSNHYLIGQEAPEIVMARLDNGEKQSLAALRGQTVMLNFWATWCPPCRYEMPFLMSVYERYKDQGLEILAIDAGEKVPPDQVVDRVTKYVEGMQLPFPVLLDDNTYEVQRLYAVTGLPATFIIDTEGKVVNHHGGMFPDEASLDAFVQDAMGAAAAAQ